MKNKLLSLLLALTLIFTPVLAESPASTEVNTPTATEEAEADTPAITESTEIESDNPKLKNALSAFRQKNLIRDYAHLLADNYYYGVSDENLLYNVICATIDNGGRFDIDLALETMVKTLGDEYAEYYPPELYSQQLDYYNASFYGIGVTMTIQKGGTVIENVFSGSSAEMAGIQVGDQIVSVDGVDTSNYEPAATRELIIGEEGTFVDIGIVRGDELLYVRAVRQKVTESHSTMDIIENEAGRKIGYIDVDSFTASLPEDFDGYIDQLKNQGINNVIIDLRDNGGGDIDAAIEVARKLISAGIIGKLKYRDEANNVDLYSENYNAPGYEMLVLVNENTASASEFLAMALQSRNAAKLMGTKTFGKGCMQVIMHTPTGSGLKFTIGEYYSPSDQRIHGTGLTPDYAVENEVSPVNEEDFADILLAPDMLESDSTRLGVEQRLNALKLLADSEVDGIYNSRTEAAVRVFQRYSEIEITGEVDFYTAMALNDYEYNMNKVVDIQMQTALAYFK